MTRTKRKEKYRTLVLGWMIFHCITWSPNCLQWKLLPRLPEGLPPPGFQITSNQEQLQQQYLLLFFVQDHHLLSMPLKFLLLMTGKESWYRSQLRRQANQWGSREDKIKRSNNCCWTDVRFQRNRNRQINHWFFQKDWIHLQHKDLN